MLYERPPRLEAGALVRHLQSEISIDLVSESESIVQLAHRDHLVHTAEGDIPSLTNIVRWSKPVGPADFADALGQTWDWPEAEATISRCAHKLLVSDLLGAGLPYQDRYRLIVAVTVGVAELTNPAAIHWEPAGCLVQTERLRRRLSFFCNVRLHDILDRKGDELMDTLGLAALGLVDAQCLYRSLDSSEMARWMYALGRQIFVNGDFIKDGEAIAGLDPAQRWVCHHETPLIPPPRSVLDVKPPAPYAGRR